MVLAADFNLQFVVDIHVGIDPSVSFVFDTPLWEKEYQVLHPFGNLYPNYFEVDHMWIIECINFVH